MSSLDSTPQFVQITHKPPSIKNRGPQPNLPCPSAQPSSQNGSRALARSSKPQAYPHTSVPRSVHPSHATAQSSHREHKPHVGISRQRASRRAPVRRRARSSLSSAGSIPGRLVMVLRDLDLDLDLELELRRRRHYRSD